MTLIFVGVVSFLLEEVPLSIAITGFGANVNLLSLFLLIPLIGTFMSTSGYLSILKEKVQAREEKGQQHPYRLSYFLIATIGTILNYGTLAIVKKIAEESFSSYQDKKITLNIMRAFGFCMLWSPYFVNVGLILVLFDLSWINFGLYGLFLAIIYLLISWLMFNKISYADDPIVGATRETTPKKDTSLVPFFTFIFVLICLSFILDYLLPVNMLTVVSLIAIVFPFIWAIFSNVIKFYIHDVVEQVLHSFFKVKNELAVFISAGFFGVALAQTEIGAYVSGLLFQASLGSVYLLSIFIVFLAIILAQIGIHPLIIIIGIGSSLSPLKFGVSPEYMALILLIAWTTATQISPFSGQVLMASHLMHQSPTVVIKENYQFALTTALVLTTVVYGLFMIGLL
ncbi:hypothetical protein RJD24_10150 [Bacillaceae bacterium IKA-2]|nr:hypothetical protein RJD24_10150 [Bacillaceae bacterium IKA-2]